MILFELYQCLTLGRNQFVRTHTCLIIFRLVHKCFIRFWDGEQSHQFKKRKEDFYLETFSYGRVFIECY